MRFVRFLLFVVLATRVSAQEAKPPADNRYDVLGKMLAPVVNILLAGPKGPNRGSSMTIEVTEVNGRLPAQFKGASLFAAVQNPDKVKLVAPVLGDEVTVCRNGNEVWATPGAKIEFLLGQFKIKPGPSRKSNTPLVLPITAQQAIFLPALFSLNEGGYESVEGVNCRLIEGGLTPELGTAAKAEDFRARFWVGPGYIPRQVEIVRKDFSMRVALRDLIFVPSLPASTWEPPVGVTDIYRCSPEYLERVLFVVMNSLQMKEEDAPWAKAK